MSNGMEYLKQMEGVEITLDRGLYVMDDNTRKILDGIKNPKYGKTYKYLLLNEAIPSLGVEADKFSIKVSGGKLSYVILQ